MLPNHWGFKMYYKITITMTVQDLHLKGLTVDYIIFLFITLLLQVDARKLILISQSN